MNLSSLAGAGTPGHGQHSNTIERLRADLRPAETFTNAMNLE